MYPNKLLKAREYFRNLCSPSC